VSTSSRRPSVPLPANFFAHKDDEEGVYHPLVVGSKPFPLYAARSAKTYPAKQTLVVEKEKYDPAAVSKTSYSYLFSFFPPAHSSTPSLLSGAIQTSRGC
jgi:hypothetical protein